MSCEQAQMSADVEQKSGDSNSGEISLVPMYLDTAALVA